MVRVGSGWQACRDSHRLPQARPRFVMAFMKGSPPAGIASKVSRTPKVAAHSRLGATRGICGRYRHNGPAVRRRRPCDQPRHTHRALTRHTEPDGDVSRSGRRDSAGVSLEGVKFVGPASQFEPQRPVALRCSEIVNTHWLRPFGLGTLTAVFDPDQSHASLKCGQLAKNA